MLKGVQELILDAVVAIFDDLVDLIDATKWIVDDILQHSQRPLGTPDSRREEALPIQECGINYFESAPLGSVPIPVSRLAIGFPKQGLVGDISTSARGAF